MAYLYIATGDGGGGGDPLDSGRKLATLLAKILRIDVDVEAGADPPYGIPDDNPFLDLSGARHEIWLTGLRNPWRMRFDRATGDLWIGDVGQRDARGDRRGARAASGGLDFGWNIMEGSSCYRDGGQRLPDRRADPAGHGVQPRPWMLRDRWDRLPRRGATGAARLVRLRRLLFGAVLGPRSRRSDELRDPTLAAESERSISAIAEDAAGELFATDLSGGELLRVVVDGG